MIYDISGRVTITGSTRASAIKHITDSLPLLGARDISVKNGWIEFWGGWLGTPKRFLGGGAVAYGQIAIHDRPLKQLEVTYRMSLIGPRTIALLGPVLASLVFVSGFQSFRDFLLVLILGPALYGMVWTLVSVRFRGYLRRMCRLS
jgi:hypothetical protein